MSYIQQTPTGAGSGTVTNTGGALTANALVLGAGGNDTKVSTTLTTDGTHTITAGGTGAGSGVLALGGNTSGTATITAPAVAGTVTNPIVSSNVLQVPAGSTAAPAVQFAGAGLGFYKGTNSSGPVAVVGNVDIMDIHSAGARIISSGVFGITPGAPDAAGADTGLSRLAAGIWAVGTGAASSKAGLIQSGMTVFVTSNFTTSGVGTALEAITGLSITLPAVAANWSFHAHLAYSQAVATAAVGFGIQAVTNAPTNIFATGEQFTAAGTVTTGVLATLSTTTATQIVSGTPGATATNLKCDIYGTAELGASANTIRLLVSTATAADLVTVLRGSYFSFCP